MVQYVETEEDFDAILKEHTLVAVDFTATWCGPCKMIGPEFEKFSTQYTDIFFVKVDVDKAGELSQKYGIRSMPTFMFFKDGKKVETFSGADKGKLEAHLKRLRS